ncbi:phytoene desaturase family protein [Nakamurella endophytica]|uniref:Pyridine nucleotide-disulfide oxidoreductase domain-containing protein 2 n=1 Tax=Nakamurella endophytica TaxID=1748367 RepID=A0A917WN85_9ACTN|nr:NAD(P)/FAD-dependent oxidoreductase [Nakamurella endophytica]GGM16692.1 FAD-dependent oxidoreductase [Nakamurella endophytica]
MTRETVDAVVVGAGPNGLVAANALADAGWSVLLLEANPDVGGAVRHAEVTVPGFVSDLYSAFYPLAAASPVIRNLDLQDHGLTWVHAGDVLSHALPDGRSVVLSRDPQRTAASVEAFAPGDGQAWLGMFEQWRRIRDPLLDALFVPFPPVRAALSLLGRTRVRGALDLARLAMLPVRRLAQENFSGDGAALLLTGNAMHSDVPPESAGSGVMGWLLAMLGQDVGFPVPQGGAGNLAESLRRRLESRGGQVRTGARVDQVVVSGGRAVGVRCADGTAVRARHAVLADVAAPTLYRQLVGPGHLPGQFLADLDRFHWDNPTLKINWALSGPVPWRAEDARQAGTVHYGVDLDGFVDFAGDLTVGRVPRHPFVLFGQMTTTDPTRSPAGTESAWAYTHLPRQALERGDAGASPESADVLAAHVDRVEEHLETVAPGFRDRVLARDVQTPRDLSATDANLVHGAINSGTSYPHQQLVFRPTPGFGRPETPIPGLYLASASAHPGGGVHGACGWNAARAALHTAGPRHVVRRALFRTAWGRLLRP